MPLDITPAPAGSVGGEAQPGWTLTPVADVTIFAAGAEYEDPDAKPRCPETTKAGDPCKGFAGASGLCVGHQKVAEARARRTAE